MGASRTKAAKTSILRRIAAAGVKRIVPDGAIPLLMCFLSGGDAAGFAGRPKYTIASAWSDRDGETIFLWTEVAGLGLYGPVSNGLDFPGRTL